MRLQQIKVSGFKSFVDPTAVHLTADMVGIVGPNGCGKSNVIDAVRWVMGESSARNLRGESMADVIFNGSRTRKPVGKASVELVFSNSDGRLGGAWGQYSEISVRRTLTRDGQSLYFLNKAKCRRRDIVDLFRGTGLGARSYSIIEQGMVTRVVESKPEELRTFVEEAAGISRYKDRRRETESRIRHTRENLERVEDIRSELATRLRRLKRQSNAARRFKVLKGEERLLHGRLLALRYLDLSRQLEQQDRMAAGFENALQARVAAQREAERRLEAVRAQQSAAQDALNAIQGEYYAVGAEISGLEQRIDHLRETRQRQESDLARLTQGRDLTAEQLADDRRRLAQIEEELARLGPELERERALHADHESRLAAAEERLQAWQREWEAFNRELQMPAQQREVQKSRIGQLQRQLDLAERRRGRLQEELAALEVEQDKSDLEALRGRVLEHDRLCEGREAAFREQEEALHDLRGIQQQRRDELAEMRARQQEIASRLGSLREIQQAALGGDDAALQAWLERRGLAGGRRLAGLITVRDGWQRAADRVLERHLGAVSVAELSIELLDDLPDSALTLVAGGVAGDAGAGAQPGLLDKVEATEIDLAPLLAGVYIAEDLSAALTMRPRLRGRECVVTRDAFLVGANWISRASNSQGETGVLVRQEEIKQLADRLAEVERSVGVAEKEISRLEERRRELEQMLGESRVQLGRLRGERTELHNRLGREESRHSHLAERSAKLREEIDELQQQSAADRRELALARQLLESADSSREALEERRQELEREKSALQAVLQETREALRGSRTALHERELRRQRLEAAADSLRESCGRLEGQLNQAQREVEALQQELGTAEQPVAEMRRQLKVLLEKRIGIERRLSAARDGVSGFEEQILDLGRRRSELEREVNAARDDLERHRMQRQEAVVRRDTLAEQIAEEGYDRRAILAEMPEEAAIETLAEELAGVQRRIERIGPVNLVAIEEYEEQSERKQYLDQQYDDLSQALATLEGVIRRIDRETRTRFRETFDALNAGFAEFFPRLFGGGRAELQLTGDDLLTAGVTVMAQPPGKRNSTIHLLSGGEKALTAVALLFALFKLNPAPFCLLDEVDAPLDDANVERYCETLRSLTEASQIIVITHNKITMEAADRLIGVTMVEAGVSRTVSVDMEQAMQMAAQA